MVFVGNFSQRLSTKVWLPGHIVGASGPLSYLIRLVESHQIVHCHNKHIQTRPAGIMLDTLISRNGDQGCSDNQVGQVLARPIIAREEITPKKLSFATVLSLARRPILITFLAFV